MKALTIEQLKALEVGDWVWVVEKEDAYPTHDFRGEYCRKVPPYLDGFCYGWQGFGGFYKYEDYGTKWLAYKNKEQAEAKGEIVELPCKVGDTVYRLHRATKEIVEWEIGSIKLSKSETIFVCGHNGTEDYMAFGKTEIGERFFTSKPEAERRLAELKGE